MSQLSSSLAELSRSGSAYSVNTSIDRHVRVIGGGRIGDGYVITPELKGHLVDRLRNQHQVTVWAFGDSILDLEMLKKADRAVVVVGKDTATSRAMEAAVHEAMENEGLQVEQLVLPPDAPVRFDTLKIPQLDISDKAFLDSIDKCQRWHTDTKVFHATERAAAKVLMTPTRDARISGPGLREAHQQIGRYLATEILTEIIGVEEYQIPHVQGKMTTGFQLLNEEKTLIVPLMRGGEPMAFGINDVFPLARFCHAKTPSCLTSAHFEGMRTVLLVDSVVNSGGSVMGFVNHIRPKYPGMRIVIVAGVVQAGALESSALKQALIIDYDLRLVALRLSENQYKGSKGSDTGNRLFNTMHMA